MSVESTVNTVDLPSGWRETPLRSVANVRFSSVDKLSHESEVPVKLCNYTDVNSEDYITAGLDFMEATATDNEIRRFALEVGDVLITKDSETPDDIGIPTIVDETVPILVCGYHLGLIRPDPNQVDSTFLGKQIAHRRIARYFAHKANGLTRYGLPIGAVEQTPIWLPPISSQTSIGAILRKIDALIESSEAVLAKLRQVRTGLLHDLLTRGLDADGQLRDPDAHPEQFKDSPLGRIPREWEVRRLSEMCVHLGSGLTPRGGQDVYTSDGVMLIRSQNVHFDGLRLDEVAFISENTHLGMRRSEVHAHDVLYNITGASIGRCCAMPDGLGPANVNQHVCILRLPDADASSASCLAAVISSPIGQRQLEALNTTGNRQGLNFQQLGAFLIPWPQSFDEPKAIAALLATHDRHIESEQATLAKLRQLKSGLMTDLLEGRVRVPEELTCEPARTSAAKGVDLQPE